MYGVASHPKAQEKHPPKKYEIHNHVLEAVDSSKYLGIIFDSKLSFNHHIQDITNKSAMGAGVYLTLAEVTG